MALDIDGFSKAADDYVSQKQEVNTPEPSFGEKAWNTAKEAGGAVVNAIENYDGLIENTVVDTGKAIYNVGVAYHDYVAAGNGYGDGDVDEARENVNQAWSQLAAAPAKEATREIINAYADDDESFMQPLAQNLRRSETNIDYFMTDDEKIAKARDIEAETDIPAATIMYDNEAYKKAMEIYDYTMKQKKLVPDGEFSMDKVWDEFPGLKDIASMDPQSAALALHDIESVRATHGIVDTFTKMLEFGNEKLEYDNLQYKIMTGKADDNDLQRAQDLKEKMENEVALPSLLDNPLAYVAAGIAGSAPEMWQSTVEMAKDFGEGYLAGAAAGAVMGSIGTPVGGLISAGTGGLYGGALNTVRGYAARKSAVEAAKVVGSGMARYGMFSGMFRPEAGDRYGDYTDMKDKNGNPLLSPQAARDYAVVGGALNAGIEMADFGIIKNALKGAPHANAVLKSIIGRANAEVSAKKELENFVADRAGSMLKVAAGETAEEGLQSVSDDLVHNDIEMQTGDTANGGAYNYKTIAARALASMGEALPASLGFGVASAGGGAAFGSLGLARNVRHISEDNAKYSSNAKKTMIGTMMAEQLQQAVSDSKLKHTAPDVQEKLIRDQLAGTGYENVYIDTEMAMEKENGLEDLKKAAAAGGYSSEDLETAIASKGNLLVPMEKFSQAATSPELLESVSFSPDAEPVARMAKNAKEITQEMQDRMKKAVDQQINITNAVTQQLFPVDDSLPEEEKKAAQSYRDMATAAIYTNPENPAQGWNELYKTATQEKAELIGPALDALKRGMGNGVDIIQGDDGRGTRVSNNEQWYRDFYAAYGRAPRAQELEDMARAMVTGDASAPKVEGWIPTTEEEQNAMAESRNALDAIYKRIDDLNAIKDRMSSLTGTEMALTNGLTPEGFAVYRNMSENIKSVGGRPGRAARMDAILFARHADIYAAIMSKKSGKKYTAMDYYRERYNPSLSGRYSEGLQQVAWHGTPHDFDSFNTERIGSGSGMNMHGWGIYFAANRKEVEKYKKISGKNGKTIKTEIPEKNELLYENKPFKEQPEEIKRGLEKTYASLNKNQKRVFADRLIKPAQKGKEFIESSKKLKIMQAALSSFDKIKKPDELSAFQRNLSKKNFLAAGFTEDEIESFMGNADRAAAGKALYEKKVSGDIKAETDKISSLQKEMDAADENSRKNLFSGLEKSDIITGKQIYDALSLALGSDIKAASMAMNKAGIRGIDYVGGDGHCFVVFDDKAAKIIEKFNQEQSVGKRSAAFKNWFGKSVVVDKAGDPLVVYHGTATPGIDVFNSRKAQDKAGREYGMGWGKGKFYFTASKMMADAAASGAEYRGQGKNKQAMPLYLRIEKPMSIEEYQKRYSEISGGHRLGGESYTDDYGMKDRDKFIAKLDKQLKNEGYDGIVDGETYAVFDNKNIKSVNNAGNFDAADPNIYHQGEAKGEITPLSNGQRVITLFESADESTFLHEMGHMFLMDLEDLARIDDVSSRQLEIVDEWATWEKGAAKEYKDTAWADEFGMRERNIIAAEEAGDIAEAERLKRQWRQERFARAFEIYLQRGTAPAKGLKSVFRAFKKFLRDIYIGFTSTGGQASPKVEAIMARMVATEQEIDEAALDDRFRDLSKAGGEKLLDETEQETYQRWHEEAMAEAKEKLMAIVMQDLTEENQRKVKQRLDAERQRKLSELKNTPIYIARELAKTAGDDRIVEELGFFPSVDAYKEELAKTPSMEDALESHMVAYENALDKESIESHFSDERIAEVMESTPYHKKLVALEAQAFAEKEKLVTKINSKAEAAMADVMDKINALPEDADLVVDKMQPRVREVMQAINRMRFAAKWEPKDFARIQDLLKAATREEMVEAMKKFRAEASTYKENLQAVENAAQGKLRIYEEMAKKAVRSNPIHEACSYDTYRRNEKIAAKRVQQAVRAGKWQLAMRQKEAQYMSAAMAAEAKKAQEHVNKLLDKVKRQLKARSVKLPKDERYWHKHLAYALRLVPDDAVKPVDGVIGLAEIFSGLNESLDIENQPVNVLDMVQREGFKDYRSLTLGEFEEAVDALTVLYTTGRDKFKLKSIAGKTIADVVDAIGADPTAVAGTDINAHLVNDDEGGLGYSDIIAKIPGAGKPLAGLGRKYLSITMKPEEIIKLLGNTAHRYLYGLYERAASTEGTMAAKNITALRGILSAYSHNEKRSWKKKKYIFQDKNDLLSKENIICMALNLGNEINTARLCVSFGADENTVREFVYKNMEKKDWETVQKMWDHINSYWEDTVRVEEQLNGVTLEKQVAKPFDVVLPGGETIHMAGGYYPIKANPLKNSRVKDQSVDEAARRTMSGAQVLGTGRGFTKGRSESLEINRPMLLTFDVIPEHLQNVIHNIAFRIAARDVYRLVNNTHFEDIAETRLGREAYAVIKEWAVDCWKIIPETNNQAAGMLERGIGWLRRNATLNIMGYRMWPAVENITNIFPVMDEIGMTNALRGVGDYYAHFAEYKKLMNKSVFMRNRINNMDRDMRSQPGLFNEAPRGMEELKNHAYWFMAKTDLMFSAPLWCRAYKDAFQGKYEEVMRENAENMRAVEDAQQAVAEKKAGMMELYKRRKDIGDEIAERQYADASKNSAYGGWAVDDLQAEIENINAQLKPKEKELWEAEVKLDAISGMKFLTEDDIRKEAEERSVQAADAAVRNTFGSGEIKDQASVQKGSEMAKLFTSFYSFFNTQANAILAAYYKGKFTHEPITGLQNASRWMPLARAIFFRVVLTSALATAMKMALLGDGSDDKEKYRKVKGQDGKEEREEIPFMERFFVQFAKNIISTASGTMIGVREVANLLSSMIFDGTDYGKGFNFGSVPRRVFDQGEALYKLVSKKGERDEQIEEKRAKEAAKYDKMTKKQKAAWDAKQPYRKPDHRITYADIIKAAGGVGTSLTATKTGITDTMANAVLTTMQYMADGDGRYDSTAKNIIWSAIWNKKPVEREIPKAPPKPPKPPAKNRNRRKKN